MKAKKIFENIEFKRGGQSITKSLSIGKYYPKIIEFKDYDGNTETIEIHNDMFHFREMKVRLEFQESNNIAQMITVYIDREKQEDMSVFQITPSEYEFFVPDKPSIEIDGEYKFDPNPENWSKTNSVYGFPLVDENNKEKLKEMQIKYGYWYVSYMDYTKTDKNPFVAVAKMIAYTF